MMAVPNEFFNNEGGRRHGGEALYRIRAPEKASGQGAESKTVH